VTDSKGALGLTMGAVGRPDEDDELRRKKRARGLGWNTGTEEANMQARRVVSVGEYLFGDAEPCAKCKSTSTFPSFLIFPVLSATPKIRMPSEGNCALSQGGHSEGVLLS